MSLIAFHKFLISTAIVFCLGFAFRQLSEFQATGEGWTLITAIAFGTAAVVLVYYLRHLSVILHLPTPHADLRPFVKSQTGSLSHTVFPLVDAHDEAEAGDVIPAASGNGRKPSKMPPIKENGREG